MTMRAFIQQNREELDRCVWNFTAHRYRQPQKLTNDRERQEWIMNDEGLYLWAKREGVKI
jgi:hypothetical protein